jgi:hypothetical protein
VSRFCIASPAGAWHHRVIADVVGHAFSHGFHSGPLLLWYFQPFASPDALHWAGEREAS